MELHCRGPLDVREMLLRIVKYHRPRVSPDTRERVHNLYDLLLRRLLSGEDLREVDGLTEVLTFMTGEVQGPVCANLWTRLLVSMHGRLEKGLRDYALGGADRCWPSPGALCVLRLLPLLFPTTDYRHPVVTPALLYLGQCLSECPVTSMADLTAGLSCAALMLHYTAEAKRLAPEALAFLCTTLGALGPLKKGTGTQAAQQLQLPTFHPTLVKKLRMGLKAWEGKEAELGPLDMARAEDKEVREEEAAATLRMVCKTLARAAQNQCSGMQGAPELLGEALRQLTWHASREEGTEKGQWLSEARDSVKGVVESVGQTRRPLVWRSKDRGVIKSLDPRMVEDYVVKKDAGMDRDKAKVKQLTRQLKREKKGAMRELRRDAAFIDAEVTKQKAEREDERKKALAANSAWLQEQQATMNLQVKKSKGEDLRGGGSGVGKKRR